ncbi:surface antigen-domain-containing protein [Paraphysoderma sedebokerense]|nr:surface antigen-domain-containing protein [Paraphysoderma sedebokerense]
MFQNERQGKFEDPRRLAEVIKHNYAKPMLIHRISFLGIERTKQTLLETYIKPALRSATLGDILSNLQSAIDGLNRLGIFDNVNIVLDTIGEKDGNGPVELVDVVVKVKEKGLLLSKMDTSVGDSEGRLSASFSVRNVFGAAELLRTNISFGTRTSSAFECSFLKPINANPATLLEISAFNLIKNFQSTSGHDELVRGVYAKYYTYSSYGRHSFSYDLDWRQVCNLASNASLSVRHEAGHSLKSSISHIFERDLRDNQLLPTRGYFVKLHNEFAGLGGSVKYLKNELDSQLAIPLGQGFSLSTTLRTGLIVPFDNDRTRINDRFFVGGVTSVRGFEYHGIGPRDGRDALGGDVHYQLGVSLFTPIPKLSDKEWIKGHVWVNGGNLSQVNTDTKLVPTIFNSPPTISIGTGVVLRHPMCRLEFNFGVPFQVRQGDQIKKGWSVGLGISFL